MNTRERTLQIANKGGKERKGGMEEERGMSGG